MGIIVFVGLLVVLGRVFNSWMFNPPPRLLYFIIYEAVGKHACEEIYMFITVIIITQSLII